MSSTNLPLLLRGSQTPDWDGPALVRFNYLFRNNFPTMCMAYMRRFNYEPRTRLTTISNVEQPDDDTLVYFRRQEKITSETPGYERITINRRDQTMTCESIHPTPDGSVGVAVRNIFTPEGENTRETQEVFAAIEKQFTVKQFKS